MFEVRDFMWATWMKSTTRITSSGAEGVFVPSNFKRDSNAVTPVVDYAESLCLPEVCAENRAAGIRHISADEEAYMLGPACVTG